jgi:hypothetical protein
LRATQTNYRAIRGSTPIVLFVRVLPQLFVFELLVGEEEHVANVGQDVDHAARDGGLRLVAGHGAPSAFTPHE